MVTVSARISKSGQVTIPAEIREKMGVKPGDTVLWRIDEDGAASVTRIKYRFEDLVGILGPIPEGMTMDELIAEATAEAMERRYRRGRGEES